MCLSLILSILLFMGYDAKLVPVVLDDACGFSQDSPDFTFWGNVEEKMLL